MLGNISENTPYGSTKVSATGNYGWTDPYTNQTYNIPTFTRDTTFSPQGQAINDQNMAAQLNLGKMANQQSSMLLDFFSKPFDPNMDYTFDSSQATGDQRTWRDYTPQQMQGMAASGGGASGSGFKAGSFNPSMNFDQWTQKGYQDWSNARTGDSSSGSSYAFAPTQKAYDEFVAGERSTFDKAERDRYTDWAMKNGQGGGGGGGQAGYTGAGGYWETTPGSPGKWVATAKTGSDRLQDWTALGNDDYEESRKRVEEALYSRLNPSLERDREALETKLANQGIMLGSDLYRQGVDEFTRQSNDARMQTVLAGGQEQSRLFGMDTTRAGFNNTLRQQQFQEALAKRNQPLNEIIGLLSGSQVQMPQFMGANMPTIPTTDNAGIIQNYDSQKLQAAQMENQATQSILGGLFGLGGKLIGTKFWQ